jgi:GTP-dependent phosphoenolpyruvate carboxykinase
MATVSWTMAADLIVNGQKKASGATVTKASVLTAEPMALIDFVAVEAADTENDWLTANET